MTQKIFSAILVVAMIFSLVGCAKDGLEAEAQDTDISTHALDGTNSDDLVECMEEEEEDFPFPHDERSYDATIRYLEQLEGSYANGFSELRGAWDEQDFDAVIRGFNLATSALHSVREGVVDVEIQRVRGLRLPNDRSEWVSVTTLHVEYSEMVLEAVENSNFASICAFLDANEFTATNISRELSGWAHYSDNICSVVKALEDYNSARSELLRSELQLIMEIPASDDSDIPTIDNGE